MHFSSKRHYHISDPGTRGIVRAIHQTASSIETLFRRHEIATRVHNRQVELARARNLRYQRKMGPVKGSVLEDPLCFQSEAKLAPRIERRESKAGAFPAVVEAGKGLAARSARQAHKVDTQKDLLEFLNPDPESAYYEEIMDTIFLDEAAEGQKEHSSVFDKKNPLLNSSLWTAEHNATFSCVIHPAESSASVDDEDEADNLLSWLASCDNYRRTCMRALRRGRSPPPRTPPVRAPSLTKSASVGFGGTAVESEAGSEPPSPTSLTPMKS
eukprot:Sspe_Gene.78459::Locus_49069_Transcript_1_1_Confidence_1.000_Length_868::g.78459::m.78459